jgi:ribonuclease-3
VSETDTVEEPPGLEALAERLGHRFERLELLAAAVTHRSFANERGTGENYERLEFLGDAVLGMLTAEWLYERYPEMSEGVLSKLKSQLVRTKALVVHAERLGLGDVLRLGVGEERSGGRSKDSLLEDAMEAVLGAIWLDGGVAAARALVRSCLEHAMEEREAILRADSKTRLQEAVQARGWPLPQYRVSAEDGPDHSKRFHVDCAVRGEVIGRGEGRSKKQAQQRAATEALAALDGES